MEEKKQQWSEPAYIYRLELSTVSPSDKDSRAAMMFGMDGETPVIQVWTGEKGKPPIRARLNVTAFGLHLVSLLRAATEAQEKFKGKIDLLNNRYVDGKLTPKAVHRIVVIKASNGIISLGLFDLEDESRSRVMFPLIDLDWINGIDYNGEARDPKNLSKDIALYYAKFFEHLSFNHARLQTEAQRKAFMDEIRKRKEERAEANRQKRNQDNFNDGDAL